MEFSSVICSGIAIQGYSTLHPTLHAVWVSSVFFLVTDFFYFTGEMNWTPTETLSRNVVSQPLSPTSPLTTSTYNPIETGYDAEGNEIDENGKLVDRANDGYDAEYVDLFSYTCSF